MRQAKEIAPEFAEAWTWREKLRWLLADKCALLSSQELGVLVGELSNQFGISVNLQTLKNYARVSKSFEEKERHPYKWSNYLEWSKHEDPIKAMEFALDNGYSPTQMARLRRYGDPEYKKPKPELCQVCGGDVLARCDHALTGYSNDEAKDKAWKHLGTVEFPDGEQIRVEYQDDEAKD